MTEHSGNAHPDHVSLDMLPDDIIVHVLPYVPPLDNLAGLQTLSRRFRRLACQPLLWKRHCMATFMYWQPEHTMKRRLRKKASATDWKALFLLRQKQNATMERLFASISTTRIDRIERMQQICHYGYDAKDFLIDKCRTTHDDPDVLAVRYYAEAILGSIHRNMAIQQWFRVGNPDPEDPINTKHALENSLAAFDLFVLYDQRGDLNDISGLLDTCANLFIRTQPQWGEKSTRERALALNLWLRMVNLVGMDDQRQDYRNLRNCFIGQALRHSKHESIPIISCAIYCCIAERLDLQAECVMAPVCVHVVVTAPSGFDLDMNPSQEEHQMYLDPFTMNGEVPIDRLEHLAAHADMTMADLRNSGTVLAVTTRTARNIEASHAASFRRAEPLSINMLLHGHPAVNRHLALYATRWALLILQVPYTHQWQERRATLLRQIQRDYPEDEWIMSWYVLAQSRRAQADQDTRLFEPGVDLRLREYPDLVRAEAFQNALTAARVAPFRLGQIIIHRRYQWIGAVVGFYEAPPDSWGVLDAASEDISEAQGAGVQKRFYVKTIAASSMDEQVIAPGNLEVIDDESQVTSTFPLAGRYFKRFDREKCRFISNIDDEYPRLAAEN